MVEHYLYHMFTSQISLLYKHFGSELTLRFVLSHAIHLYWELLLYASGMWVFSYLCKEQKRTQQK